MKAFIRCLTIVSGASFTSQLDPYILLYWVRLFTGIIVLIECLKSDLHLKKYNILFVPSQLAENRGERLGELQSISEKTRDDTVYEGTENMFYFFI